MRPTESFVGQPIRSLQTMLRVLAKDDDSLPTLVPDGIYGPQTLNAVTAFQRREGLPLTGIADNDTWDAVIAAYEPALVRIGPAEPIEIIMDPGHIFRLGDEGPYIYLMQTLLIWLSLEEDGFYTPTHNGLFDTDSQQALSDFQRIAGLHVTGELDKNTWKHLSRQFSLSAHHNADRRIITQSQRL